MNQRELKSFIELCDHVAKRDFVYEVRQEFDEFAGKIKVTLIDPCSNPEDSEIVGAFLVEYAGEFHGRKILHLVDPTWDCPGDYYIEAQPHIVISMLVEM